LSAIEPFRREAVDHFEKALEIDPSNTSVRVQLAALYEEMKLSWRARQHYQKVLEIDPVVSVLRQHITLGVIKSYFASF